MSKKRTAIVVGTGAGGAMMAKELQGAYQVTILEAGRDFRPFSWPLKLLADLRRTGVYRDARMIRTLLPSMVIEKNRTRDMILVRGKGLGGTTTLATGNAVRYDGALRKLGIDLDRQFDELHEELPITTEHRNRWTETTKKMYSIFEEMGLDPVVTPKFLYSEKCVSCGHCAIGCPTGAKWDTRALVDQAVMKGAKLITGCRVTNLEIREGRVTAVRGWYRGRKYRFHADLIVLAAGGLGTPPILERSGIPCQKSLFVDPVLCVAGPLPGLRQDRQILMPFISQQDGYILSPYMDYLSFFFDKKWNYPIEGMASMMVKLADEETGATDGRQIDKPLTVSDWERLQAGVAQCRDILEKVGVPRNNQFPGLVNAGHPGGMLPLTADQKDTLHHPALPDNLYVADATILPESMGNPPILTIMALSKKIAEKLNAAS